VCPKKKPGHSDLNEATSDIFWHWRLCNSLDEHPQEIEARRYRRILDKLQSNIEKSRNDEREFNRMMQAQDAMRGRR
jgi:hypothetical protein